MCAPVVLSAVPATGRVRGARFRRRDGGYLSRSYSDVARASVASSRCSFRASPFGMCSSPVPALLSRCFCGTATSPSAVEPGLLLRLSLQSCWGVLPPLPLWRRAATSTDPSGMVAPRQRQGLFSSFVRGQSYFQAGSVLRTQGDRCSYGHALAAEGRRGLSLLVDVLAGVFRLPELLLGASGYRGP